MQERGRGVALPSGHPPTYKLTNRQLVLTKLNGEIWEHSDIAEKKSNRASCQMVMLVFNKPLG